MELKSKRKCGILGCTGAVGQVFIYLLGSNPFFELVAVGASERSKGKKYKDATSWKQTMPMPERAAELSVVACDPGQFKHCDVVFSGLDSSVAGEVGLFVALVWIHVYLILITVNRRDPILRSQHPHLLKR